MKLVEGVTITDSSRQKIPIDESECKLHQWSSLG